MIQDVESLGLTILSQCLFAFHRAFGNSSVTNKMCGACTENADKLITRVRVTLISLCYHKLSLYFEASPLPHILAPFLQEPYHSCNCDITDPAPGLALT